MGHPLAFLYRKRRMVWEVELTERVTPCKIQVMLDMEGV
jgi:hypothetical protein